MHGRNKKRKRKKKHESARTKLENHTTYSLRSRATRISKWYNYILQFENALNRHTLLLLSSQATEHAISRNIKKYIYIHMGLRYYTRLSDYYELSHISKRHLKVIHFRNAVDSDKKKIHVRNKKKLQIPIYVSIKNFRTNKSLAFSWFFFFVLFLDFNYLICKYFYFYTENERRKYSISGSNIERVVPCQAH